MHLASPIAVLCSLILAFNTSLSGNAYGALSGEAQVADATCASLALDALAGFIEPYEQGVLAVDFLLYESTEEEDLDKKVASRRQAISDFAADLNAISTIKRLVSAQNNALAGYRGEAFTAPFSLYIRFGNFRL